MEHLFIGCRDGMALPGGLVGGAIPQPRSVSRPMRHMGIKADRQVIKQGVQSTEPGIKFPSVNKKSEKETLQ